MMEYYEQDGEQQFQYDFPTQVSKLIKKYIVALVYILLTDRSPLLI